MNNLTSPLEYFYKWEKSTPDLIFTRQSLGSGKWHELSWREYSDQARRLAGFLRDQSYPPGSRIALWSVNTVDWVVADLAIMLAGHVSVPINPAQDAETVKYFLEHSETKLALLGIFSEAGNVDDILGSDITRVAMMGYSGTADIALKDVVKSHPPLTESPVPDGEELMTIIYSSGTTGLPKGIMHLHRTHGLLAEKASEILRLKMYDPSDPVSRMRTFSFLPMAHIAEKNSVWLSSLYNNAELSISAGLDSFVDEIRSIQPTFFFGVPRIWENFRTRVIAELPDAVTPEKLTEDVRALILKQLGLSAVTCCISGGAPIAAKVHEWYVSLGLNLREAYGTTETSGTATFSPPDKTPVPGCAGNGQGVAEIKISDQGEILVKTDGLMSGYYKNPEKTAEVLVDGWYHTGDAGRLDDNGDLWVTGRLGSVFKSTKGKFVHPEPIEDQFGGVSEIEQLMVFGHGFEQPMMLITLSEAARKKAKNEVETGLLAALNRINETLAAYERVKQIFICDDEWTVTSGMITATLKAKRPVIEVAYIDRVRDNLNKATVCWLSKSAM